MNRAEKTELRKITKGQTGQMGQTGPVRIEVANV